MSTNTGAQTQAREILLEFETDFVDSHHVRSAEITSKSSTELSSSVTKISFFYIFQKLSWRESWTEITTQDRTLWLSPAPVSQVSVSNLSPHKVSVTYQINPQGGAMQLITTHPRHVYIQKLPREGLKSSSKCTKASVRGEYWTGRGV